MSGTEQAMHGQEDDIPLWDEAAVVDSQGKTWRIKRVFLLAESSCPDVIVELDESTQQAAFGTLGEDARFIAWLDGVLKTAGFDGLPPEMAESGLQTQWQVTMEMGPDFEPFARQELGWNSTIQDD